MACRFLKHTSPDSSAGFRFILTQNFRPHELSEDERVTAAQLVRERLHDTSEKVREKAKENARIAREKSKEKIEEVKKRTKVYADSK